jgi:ketosteroid isomerase-like protein
VDDPLAVVRRFADAYRTGDWPTTLALQTPDAVFVVPDDHPDGGTYNGQDEIQGYFRRWLGTWSRYDWVPARFEVNRERVAILTHETTVGKGSGVETKIDAGQIHTVRNGKIVRTEVYWTWDETLAALRS